MAAAAGGALSGERACVRVRGQGVVLYALLSARFPFDAEDVTGVYRRIKSVDLAFPDATVGGRVLAHAAVRLTQSVCVRTRSGPTYRRRLSHWSPVCFELSLRSGPRCSRCWRTNGSGRRRRMHASSVRSRLI